MTLLLSLLISIASIVTFGNEPIKPYPLNQIGITTTINQQLTIPITLYDEFNTGINLTQRIHNKPTIINFVYLSCPMLCHLLLDGLADVIKESNYKIGDDFQVITISIEPKESNENLKAYRKKYYEALGIYNGWLFLKGNKETVAQITEFFGYQYKYIPKTKDYAHPSVLYFYKDKIINYIEGVTFDKTHFDYSLMSIKDNKTLKEKFVTYCYYFDPDNQTYSLLIFKILRILCLITVLILTILISYFIYKERKMN